MERMEAAPPPPPPPPAAEHLEVEVISAQQLRRRRCGGAASYKVVAVAWVAGQRHHPRQKRFETEAASFSSDGTSVSWKDQHLYLPLPSSSSAAAGGHNHMMAAAPPYPSAPPPFSSSSSNNNNSRSNSNGWSLHIQIFYRHPLLLGLRRVIARLIIPASIVLDHCSRPDNICTFPLRTGLLHLRRRPTASLTLSFRLQHHHLPPPSYNYIHPNLPNYSSTNSAPRNATTGLPLPTPPSPVDPSRMLLLLPSSPPPLPIMDASNTSLPPPTHESGTDASMTRRASAASGILAEALTMARRRREAAGLRDGQLLASVDAGGGVSKTDDPSVSPLYPPHHIIYAHQMEKWTPGAKD